MWHPFVLTGKLTLRILSVTCFGRFYLIRIRTHETLFGLLDFDNSSLTGEDRHSYSKWNFTWARRSNSNVDISEELQTSLLTS